MKMFRDMERFETVLQKKRFITSGIVQMDGRGAYEPPKRKCQKT
jgi:hypothetical protein